MNGDQVTLADLRGRHVLLYFWNTGCAPCTAEIPELKQLQDRYPPERLTILGVAYDAERGPVERYIQHHEVPWRQILDGAENEARIHTRYEFEAWPSYYLIGPTGLIERTGRFTLHTLLDHGLEGHQTAMHRLALWLRGRTADLE